jgi:precorrin-4/cobalt-precorrin-4 C11-methyltransferase
VNAATRRAGAARVLGTPDGSSALAGSAQDGEVPAGSTPGTAAGGEAARDGGEAARDGGSPAGNTQDGRSPAGNTQDGRSPAGSAPGTAAGGEAARDGSVSGAPAPGRPAPGRAGAKVTIVGAGPGAPDLLTFRAARAIAEADIVIWAASLVQPGVLEHARADAEILDSAVMSLEDVVAVYERALRDGLRVARIHSGDPALWGGTQEQADRCARLGIEVEIVPGVSSFSAVAALAGRELTIPEIAQSVILTRLGGGKTPMPPGEEVREFARHGTTMAVFLSAARSGQLAAELLEGGYPVGTPVVMAHQVTWPDELLVRCTVGTLEETVKAHRLWKHTLFLVGPALDAAGTRSHLYHPGHFHGFRRARPAARRELREARAEHEAHGSRVPPESTGSRASSSPGPRHG